MLKRHGLIYPENPALLEVLYTLVHTALPVTLYSSTDNPQLFIANQEAGNQAPEATNPKCPEFSLQRLPNSRPQK